MDFDFSNLVSGTIGGAGGMTAAGLLVKVWLRGLMTELTELRHEVKNLREEKMGDMDRRVQKLEKKQDACPAPTIQADMTNVIGWMKTNSLKLDTVITSVHQLTAHREDDVRWMTNINASVKELERRGT